jgi:transposase
MEPIMAWRQVCQQANARSVERGREQATQNKGDRLRTKQLEQQLHRKEKALAEAASPLIMSKSPQLDRAYF